MQNRRRWGYVVLSACLASCSGSHGNSGNVDGGNDGGSDGGSGWTDNLPPPYTGDGGALTPLTPCPIPSVWPPPIAAATYDSTRKKVVVEAALAGSATSDIWDWDGVAQSFASHAQCSPNPIAVGPRLNYDPGHQLVIAYTPDVADATRNLFWEIDPTSGTATSHSVSPQASPSSGYANAFYDATLGGVVFIGSVTYVWNATSKQLVNANVAPPTTGGLSTYDAKRRLLYILSPGPTTPSFQQWSAATGNTTTINATTLPPVAKTNGVQGVQTLVLDAARDRVVAFGGYGGTVGTWEWDATTSPGTWTRVSTDNGPTTTVATFDASAGAVTAFTDHANGKYVGNIWTWNGQSWMAHAPAHLPRVWPSSLGTSSFALAYDQQRNVGVLFCQSDDGEPMGTTLEWNGTSFADRTPSDATQSPSSRHDAQIAYDGTQGRVLLFGGEDANNVALDDLWEWDGQNGVWINRTPSPRPAMWPAARSRASFSWYGAGGTVVLQGGQQIADDWEWHGADGTWTVDEVPDLVFNSPVTAFDERSGQLLMIGEPIQSNGPDPIGVASYQAGVGWNQFPPIMSAPSSVTTRGGAYDRVRGTVLFTLDGGLAEYFPPSMSFQTYPSAMLPSGWPMPWAPYMLGGMAYDTKNEQLLVLLYNGLLYARPSR